MIRPVPSAQVLFLGVALLTAPLSGTGQQVSGGNRTGAAPSADSFSVFRGRVVDHETGEALYGAAVSLASGPGGTPGLGTRVTNQEGRFLFRPVPPGTYNLTVTLLGYRTLREPLPIEGQMDLEVVLKLAVSPVELDPIEVVVERQLRGPMADFERRRQLGMGTYFTREDIEARNPYVVTDLLRTVPGVRVVPAGPFGEQAIRLRGNCRPEIIVDGVRTSIDTDVDNVLPPMDIEAVEVYKGVELPVQFGNNSCGAILFWTRVPVDTGGHGLTWTRVGITAGFILLALLGMR